MRPSKLDVLAITRMSMGRRPAVPIPKFASLRGTLIWNFGIKGSLANL